MKIHTNCKPRTLGGGNIEPIDGASKNAPDVAALKFSPPDLRAIEIQARKRRLGLFTIAENMSSRERKVTPTEIWQTFLVLFERRIEEAWEEGARCARMEFQARAWEVYRSMSGTKPTPPAAPVRVMSMRKAA